jgi:ribonuclease BN (tRNA processing enzyme)
VRLTTIGTGTAAPTPGRVSAGHLVSAGDVHLLMDCGSGVVHRMASLGIDWMSITHVAITHFHADHIADLAPLIFAWRYGDLPARSAPIEIIGPPGVNDLLSRIAAAFGDWVREPGGFAVSVRELPPDEAYVTSDVTLRAHRVPHTDVSVAYSVERRSRRIVYTGDTGFDAGFGDWARGCDVLLAECSLPASMAMSVHLTPEECGELARIAMPRLLALTHFYPPVETVDIAALVGTHFAGPLALCTDGWTTDIEEL